MSGDAQFGSNLQVIRILNTVDLHQKRHRQVIFLSNGMKGVTGCYGVHVDTNKCMIHKKPPFDFVTTNIIFARWGFCAKILRNMLEGKMRFEKIF